MFSMPVVSHYDGECNELKYCRVNEQLAAVPEPARQEVTPPLALVESTIKNNLHQWYKKFFDLVKDGPGQRPPPESAELRGY